MPAPDILQIAVETLNALWRDEVEAALVNMAEDVTWTIPGSKVGGVKQGKAAVRAFRTAGHASIFLELDRRIAHAHRAGDTVILEVAVRARTLDGAPYENALCHVWQFRGDKIIRCREYVDTERAVGAFRIAEAQKGASA